jgi:ABC-type sugar transport system ATPase subunit
MVTENRRQEGLLLPMSVRSNLSLANLRRLVSRVWPLIDNNREKALAKKLVAQLTIAATSIEQPVALLSGGNQQKVVLGRWLQKEPIVYIMDEPTRGLDVGAKAEMRRIIGDLADQGAAILLISSEIDDITSLGDRVLVMHQGRIVRELPARTSRNELISAAAGTS